MAQNRHTEKCAVYNIADYKGNQLQPIGLRIKRSGVRVAPGAPVFQGFSRFDAKQYRQEIPQENLDSPQIKQNPWPNPGTQEMVAFLRLWFWGWL